MKYLILLAEDDEDIGRAIVLRLKREGWDVLWAKDGGAALEIILEKMPDLAVLDIMMPVMNGYQLLEAIKCNDATRHIPVIFLTAKGEQSDVLKGIALHVEDYIVKPFRPNDLVSRVRRLLENITPRKRDSETPKDDDPFPPGFPPVD